MVRYLKLSMLLVAGTNQQAVNVLMFFPFQMEILHKYGLWTMQAAWDEIANSQNNRQAHPTAFK